MGPKLFAAFGAGALFASAVLFFASRSDAPVPAPAVPPVQAETVAPLPVPERPPEPPKPEAKPAAQPRPAKREKVFLAAAPPARPALSPVNVEATLPALDARVDHALPTPAVELPPRPQQSVTLQPGTLLQVRLGERLASDRHVTGDTFVATLDQPLVADGWVIAERGARLLGRVVESDPAGRVRGVSTLVLELESLTTADGQRVPIRTASFVRKGESSKKNDAVKIGVGTAIGAAIGAAVGGGKGAAVGAASGGAAGTGAVLATRGKPAVLDAETRLTFRLDQPVTITER
jgi:hypothetical protein